METIRNEKRISESLSCWSFSYKDVQFISFQCVQIDMFKQKEINVY